MADDVRKVVDSDKEFSYVKLTSYTCLPGGFRSGHADGQKVD